jgi:hypothetical protein
MAPPVTSPVVLFNNINMHDVSLLGQILDVLPV